MIQLLAATADPSTFTCFARRITTWKRWWPVRLAEWMKSVCFCYLASISVFVKIVKVSIAIVPCVSLPSLLEWRCICNVIIMKILMIKVVNHCAFHLWILHYVSLFSSIDASGCSCLTCQSLSTLWRFSSITFSLKPLVDAWNIRKTCMWPCSWKTLEIYPEVLHDIGADLWIG